MAYAFGAHPAVAALLIAFRFSSLLRRFFGEGSLQAAFVPQFEALRVKNREESYAFFRNLTILLLFLLLGITCLIELAFGFFLSLFPLSPENREIIKLSAYFFSYFVIYLSLRFECCLFTMSSHFFSA